MRKSDKDINPSLSNQIRKIFAQTVTDLRDLNESDTFLADFLTKSEYDAFAKRLAIAYFLKKGKSYSNIKNNLKVSSATIAEIRVLMEKPGIQLALKKIEAEEWANQWSEKIKKFVK